MISKKYVNSNISKAWELICQDFREHFTSNKFQEIINENCNYEEKIYIKHHIIKSLNLYTSFLLLNLNSIDIKFIDESKIMLRSLYEHILNFIYIFVIVEEEKRKNKINQFFDYAENISPYLYYSEQLKDLEQIENKNETQEELFQYILKYKNETMFNEKIEKYKKEYCTQNIYNWAGLKVEKIDEFIIDNWIFGDNLRITFKKAKKDLNPYVHCNVIQYFDKTGAITENEDLVDCLKIIILATNLFLGYIEMIIHIIGIKRDENKYFKTFFQKSDNLISTMSKSLGVQYD